MTSFGYFSLTFRYYFNAWDYRRRIMNDLLIEALRRIEALEKKLEQYYEMLYCGSELDWIWRGTYISDEELELFWEGKEVVDD